MNLSKNFTKEEMECKCGCGLFNMSPKFIMMLEKIRADIKMPMVITSGVRCENHNAKVGGSPTSAHLTGDAVDVRYTSSKMLRDMVESAMKHGANGVGVYKSWVHIDIKERENPVMWVG